MDSKSIEGEGPISAGRVERKEMGLSCSTSALDSLDALCDRSSTNKCI